MHLVHLELQEFRSYRRLDLGFDPRGIRLAGANASGKSTLLEAIAMLATTRSPRSTAERDTINWESGTDLAVPPFARLVGIVERAAGRVEIEITMQLEPTRPGTVKKQIKLGGRLVRAMDAVGTLKAVLFSPEDVMLVSGPPANRRRYMDLTISQLDGGYLRALSRYGRVLTQRNSLLKSLARDRVGAGSLGASQQLGFWDAELVGAGSLLVARRHATMARLATLAADRFQWLSGGSALTLTYRPSVDLSALGGATLPVDAATLIVAREYEAALAAARGDEVRRGVTLVGPHRDDVAFAVDGVDLAAFGSRGQQRLAVVAVKVAEADLMTEAAGEPPVVLLDDVLSELDARHRSLLTQAAAAIGAQVIVTATDESLLGGPDLAALPRAVVTVGSVEVASSPIEEN